MKILGAHLVSVTRGTATLKDAVDSAFEEYLKDPKNFIYAIGSVVGPHPFPKMVRDFQSIIGKEIKEQTHQRFGKIRIMLSHVSVAVQMQSVRLQLFKRFGCKTCRS